MSHPREKSPNQSSSVLPSTITPVSSPSTVAPSCSSYSIANRNRPDPVEAFRTYIRHAANSPSPLLPGVQGMYWLYLEPLILRGVGPEMFNRVLVERDLNGNAGGRLAAFARKSKFDYFAHSAILLITFPSRENDVAGSVVQTLRDQMWTLGFYWSQWRGDKDYIRLLGPSPITLDYGGALSKLEPDAALAWRGVRYPFLVCEVANNETNHRVLRKKHPYLLGSRGLVRFFVVVKLERADPRPKKNPLTAPDASRAAKRVRTGEVGEAAVTGQSEPRPVGKSCTTPGLPQDEPGWIPGQPKGKVTKAFISVYTSKLKLSDTGTPTRVVETIAESLEIWPRVATESLVLSWNDFGVKDVPELFQAVEVSIPYSQIYNVISRLAADESKVSGSDVLHREVDGEEVEVEWPMESTRSTESDDGYEWTQGLC